MSSYGWIFAVEGATALPFGWESGCLEGFEVVVVDFICREWVQ
jgi:hypothetical protein